MLYQPGTEYRSLHLFAGVGRIVERCLRQHGFRKAGDILYYMISLQRRPGITHETMRRYFMGLMKDIGPPSWTNLTIDSFFNDAYEYLTSYAEYRVSLTSPRENHDNSTTIPPSSSNNEHAQESVIPQELLDQFRRILRIIDEPATSEYQRASAIKLVHWIIEFPDVLIEKNSAELEASVTIPKEQPNGEQDKDKPIDLLKAVPEKKKCCSIQ